MRALVGNIEAVQELLKGDIVLLFATLDRLLR